MTDRLTKDAKNPLPGLLILGLALLLVVAAGALRAAPQAAQALKPAQRVVVLLAPGVSFADLQNSGATTASVGVFPNRLPWRVGAAKLTTLNPATPADFVRACGQLGGEKLSTALQSAGIRSVPLGGDPAARAFLGAPIVGGADPAPEWRTAHPEAADGFVTDSSRLAHAIRRATAGPSPTPLLVAATFDDLLRVDACAPLTRPVSAAAQRRAALRRLDTLLTRLTVTGPNALPPDTALLILAPVPSMEAAERGELLGPVLLRQPSAAPAALGHLLTSPSTRQTPGLLAPGDIAATVFQLSGVSENRTGGRPAAILESTNAPASDAESLVARVAHWSAQAREIRFLTTLPWLLAGTLLAAAFLWQDKTRVARVVGACASPLALLLAALFASQKPGQEALVYGSAFLMVLGVSILSALASKRQKTDGAMPLLRGLFLVTSATIVLDTLTGGTLLSRSPLSYSPIAAARFYGIGNEVSGLFLGASVLAVRAICPTPPGAVLGGLIVCLISGLPMFGADAGGFIAALIAFGVLFVLLTTARSENKRRTQLQAGIGTGIVALLLLTFYISANGRQSVGTRTHVGEAVTSARSRGAARALSPLIRRKAATGIRLLFGSPWSILLITEAGICVRLWRRRTGSSVVSDAFYRAAFTAAGALLIVNDSGVVAAATCLLYPASSLLLAPSISPPNDAKLQAADGRPD